METTEDGGEPQEETREEPQAVKEKDLAALKAERDSLHDELQRTIGRLKLARANSQASMGHQHKLNKQVMAAITEHSKAVQNHRSAMADEVEQEGVMFELMKKIWRLHSAIDQAEADDARSADRRK